MSFSGRLQLVVRGAVLCVGLGFLAGGLEVVASTARLKLPMTPVEFGVMGGAALLLLGALGGIFGLCAGVVHGVTTRLEPARAVALQMGIAGTLLCGWYLWAGALVVWGQGRIAGTVAMSCMPMVFGGVVFFNASYWLRRSLRGGARRIGWLSAASMASVVLIVGSAMAHGMRSPGGTGALEGDPNLLLITVDGLRADRIGRGDVTPRLGELAETGAIFTQVTTPMPASAAANATVLTGLHPLRHGLWAGERRLRSPGDTVAEVLEAEGYATGAFVSSADVGERSRLHRGFRVYDDAMDGWKVGVDRLSVIRRLAAWRGSDGSRTPAGTVERFVDWATTHEDVPWFGWVHLRVPEDLGGGYDDEVRSIDAQIGRVLDVIDGSGRADRTLVMVVSTYGRLLGEHGTTGTDGVWDELVRVSLVLRAPGIEVHRPRVDVQVRLMDVPATLLSYAELDPGGETEGVDLLGYVRGDRSREMWCALMGFEGGSPVIGMRSNGLKYVRDVRTGGERLFSLDDDPSEQVDLSDRQPTTLERARRLVASEEVAMKRDLH